MSNASEITNLNSYHSSWQEWQQFISVKRDELTEVESNYNTVLYNPKTEVFYKIRGYEVPSEMQKRFQKFQTMPGPYDAEAKALALAHKIKWNVPEKFSFVSPVTQKNSLLGESCLATSEVKGKPVKEILHDPSLSMDRKAEITRASYAHVYPYAFAFMDCDGENNILLTSNPKEGNYKFAQIDLQYAYVSSFNMHITQVYHVGELRKRNPIYVPDKEQMRRGFDLMRSKIEQNKNDLERNEYEFLSKNTDYGQKLIMQMVYS
jgi:hypothetical protein